MREQGKEPSNLLPQSRLRALAANEPSDQPQIAPESAVYAHQGEKYDAKDETNPDFQVQLDSKLEQSHATGSSRDHEEPVKANSKSSALRVKESSEVKATAAAPATMPLETSITGQEAADVEPVPPIITSYESLEGSMKHTKLPCEETSSREESDGSKCDHAKSPSPASLVVAGGCSSSISSNNDSVSSRKAGPPKVITTLSAVEGLLDPKSTPATASSGSQRSRQGSTNLRRGKWTVEEEAYVARVIQDFNSGFLDAPAGTTLRTYLSEKLQCDPMRITKKFTGDACIGKRVFHPAVRSPSNAAAIDKAQAELENLERRWRRRLEMQQRESAKKAAASAAAVAAGRGTGLPSSSSFDASGQPLSSDCQENVVTRTASWLDRAKSVLRAAPSTGATDSAVATSKTIPAESSDDAGGDLQTQIQEVQRLIHEGPMIEQTSAGLPDMLDQAEQHQTRSNSPPIEPADTKRMRTAEDAEALVGFLRSVRASAMSGQDY